jgi:hypothetical protein
VTDQKRLSFGLGLLCYKRYDTFRAALETYKEAGLFDLADETIVAFNELDDEGRALAEEFGLSVIGSDANTGILGGFKMLAEGLSSDIVLLLENDLPLIESAKEARRQIENAQRALASEEVEVFRFRHRIHPGYRDQSSWKFLRYYRPSLLAQIRRLLRPRKAQKMIGNAIYVLTEPDKVFDDIVRMPDGWFKISAKHITWSNQSIMIRRQFFLDNILAYAESNPSNRTVNGFPDIEKELNSAYWRNSGWRVGADLGLFTHAEP